MAGSYTTIDLSSLPAPTVIEELDFETILAEMLASLVERDPAFSALVESDPVVKALEVCAWRETLMRQRVNEAARAVMLAFAQGADLEQIGARYNVGRLQITPGDPNAVPPVAPTYEDDESLRVRIPLSLEGYTTAGSEGSYIFHAMSADGKVKDAAAVSPTPGDVSVYVLSHDGDGTAPQGLLDAVNAALNAEVVRPMTDRVTVLSASIVGYQIEAVLTVYPGPSTAAVLEAAREAINAYTAGIHRIGYDVTLSGIYKALHQEGVQNVNLVSPTANITVSAGQAAYCTGVTLSIGGDDV